MQEIYVDIDGVLTIETEGFGDEIYRNRTPNPEMIIFVNTLFETPGNTIVLWTARHEEDRTVTEEWMKNNGVKYHFLIFGKPKYDLLIDDKAFYIKRI